MARPGLTRHRKFLRIARTLGNVPLALGCLELIWEKCYESGDPYLGDALDVEAAAQWPGDAGVLCNALLTAGGEGNHGFIEQVEDRPGHYRVHDLFDHAPDYVGRRLEREMKRKENGVTLSQIRADAGRKGAEATNAKKSAKSGNWLANERQVAVTPAPAPAPIEEPSPELFGSDVLVPKPRKRRTIKSPLPENFTISSDVRRWASDHGYDRLEERLEQFIGYCRAHGRIYADWDQAFMNAIRGNWANLDRSNGSDKERSPTLPLSPSERFQKQVHGATPQPGGVQ